MKIFFYILCVFFVCVPNARAGAGGSMKYLNIKDVPTEKWQELSEKVIYFGHQSVGYNIIAGLRDIINNHPEIHLNIVESRKWDGKKGEFLHSRIGVNRKPDAKITDFVHVINQELGTTPDMAFLKFCFVDAHDSINVNKLFRHYKEAMAALKIEHPDLKIIHFTMPLRVQEITWKIRIKLKLGKDVWEFEDNVKRNEYNRLLLAEYKGKEPVFDIARFEATAPNGEVTKFQYQDDEYLAVNPEYSDDGGHLNKVGRKIIAENLLLFLVNN